MFVAQTAAAAGSNQHSVARNAFVFVLKTDNFWLVSRQYSSTSEHIHSMFTAFLLIVHTSEHHVLGCRVRLCCGICSIVCTSLYVTCCTSSLSSHNIRVRQPRYYNIFVVQDEYYMWGYKIPLKNINIP